jgi:hypothetical protein
MSPIERISDIGDILYELDTPSKPAKRTEVPRDLPTVLFRAFTTKTIGLNTAKGFKASHFNFDRVSPRAIPPPPSVNDYSFQLSAASHWSRDKNGSPFISTTSSLLFAVHKALQEDINPSEVFLAIIDPSQIDRRYIYYGGDLYPKIKDMLPKTRQYQKYQGSTEYLIYFEITQTAILHTVSLQQIFELCHQSPSAEAIFRIEFIKDHLRLGVPKVARHFGQSPLELNDLHQAGFANILLTLGVTPSSTPNLITGAIKALIDGWSFKTPELRHVDSAFEQWVFFWTKTTEIQTIPDMRGAQAAFNEGIVLGLDGLKRWAKRSSKTGMVFSPSTDIRINLQIEPIVID